MHYRAFVLLLMWVLLAACDESIRFEQAEPEESLQGGRGTVNLVGANAFSMPSANLTPLRKVDFGVGNSFFRNPWVIAPSSTTARDGLGPLFNTNACQNCHIKDGRGHPLEPDAANAVSLLVRVSIPAGADQRDAIRRHGTIPEPTYGGQLQDMAIPGMAPEAKVRFEYSYHTVKLKDGTEVELRRPKLQLSELGYGPLHPETQFSARVAPPMIGLGLLEAVPAQQILALADPDDRNGDGISGRPNQVWDTDKQATVLGRFGWKAGQPTLDQQNMSAFAGDMGLTSLMVPADDCSVQQPECLSAAQGGTPEVSEKIRGQVLFYSRNLAVPARRRANEPDVLAGKGVFHTLGCQKCHHPVMTTDADAAEPEQRNQTLRPYTDLLLHDMGDALADNRPEFEADGREWRTPPLWGIGLTQAVNGHTQFLHDGRARNLLEAILWHGGEAEAARNATIQLSTADRNALLTFLNSL